MRWLGLSFWHCSWVSELELDVYHPAMYRIYMRKNDMDEPPPLEDGSSYGGKEKKKKIVDDDPDNLEERFYKYGVRPDWLTIHRIINHRYVIDNSASEPKKGTLPFISVQHTLYAVLYRTIYRYCKQAVISK